LTPERAAEIYRRSVRTTSVTLAKRLGADLALAAAVTAFMVVGTIGAANETTLPVARDLDALTFVLIAVAGLGLALRRFRPLLGLALAVVATAVYLALNFPYGPIFFSVAITTYSVAAHHPVRRSLPAWAATAVLLAVPAGTDADWDGPLLAAVQLAGFLSWSLAAWAIGTVVRTARASAGRSRAERERQQAYEERLRTAQDVHDIVGHGLAAISMQAGVALHVLERSPARARELLEAIRQSSQQSLDELRATLAVFRASGAETEADRAPLAGLHDMDVLLTRMADSGVPVELRTSGEPVQLLSSVDNAAYRIVQESLTNVLRHADAASAEVHVAYGPDALVLEITDTGRGPRRTAPDGQGLAGMAARARSLGGSVHTGPGPTGGFLVRARLPIGGRR